MKNQFAIDALPLPIFTARQPSRQLGPGLRFARSCA